MTQSITIKVTQYNLSFDLIAPLLPNMQVQNTFKAIFKIGRLFSKLAQIS